jgi:hypothetical protein
MCLKSEIIFSAKGDVEKFFLLIKGTEEKTTDDDSLKRNRGGFYDNT